MDRKTFARILSGAACAAALLAGGQASADDSTQTLDNVEMSGDLLQFGVPVIGLALTFLLTRDRDTPKFDFSMLAAPAAPGVADGDVAGGLNWPGPTLNGSPQRDFALAFTRMEVATYGLKYAVDAERPNGGPRSFPSGHTASAFMGAEFIRKEYGWGWGVPAYLTAGWVGYSRVETHNHYWRDVVAGALIGVASNHDFDTIRLRHGELSIGPTMLLPNSVSRPAAASGWNDDKESGVLNGGHLDLSPGLQVRWTF
ncbi:phosphatase PAP2 family protein [Solimonas sp. K1W22B-7]|uniref:phosphatase PAP2 family protein n=1 Tax=Solimonas sp. K1W22B-7 TaxID=2303331 RepID=UPI00196971C0|nr:phosphatase PAP2 family protein [Solimonas sp. K1W22B-7]